MAKNNTKHLLSVEKIDRTKLLDISSWLVEDVRSRVDTDRFREREGDSVKLQYLRVLVQAVQAHNAILRDTELDDIKKRLDSLEASKHDTINDQEETFTA
jgi:hypothetical protein